MHEPIAIATILALLAFSGTAPTPTGAKTCHTAPVFAFLTDCRN
jgi:hypothetical protein